MAAIQKIFNTKHFGVFFVFLAFLLMAGFLFFGNYANAGLEEDSGAIVQSRELNDAASKAASSYGDSCQGLSWVRFPIICSLQVVLAFVTVILSAAATLFGWIVTVGNMNMILDAGAGGTGGSVIYELWRMVRDLLNIAFILVLLFSAFATIFQVEKYNYKKLLLNLVLMALLVNFSYPIARFIIDVSNVLMYTLIRNLLGANGNNPQQALGLITDKSGIVNMLTPATASITYLLSAIVFTFIMAITLLAVGAMFIIRMVALAILIIFSPIAFVGALLPGTKAGSLSSDWWSNLFKYAFFGPMMIFILYITTRIMSVIGSAGNIQSFISAGKNNAGDPNIVGTIAFFSIPVILLWMGMGVAQKSGLAGAETVMGYAQKTAKWAGKKGSGYSWGKKQYDDYAAIKKKEKEDALKNKPHFVDRSLARFGNEKAKERVAKKHKDKNKDDIDKGAKDLVESGETTDSLATTINKDFNNPSGDKVNTAKHATAYLRQDADERKMHVQSTLGQAGGIKGSDLENILNDDGKGLTGPALTTHEKYQREAQQAAERIATARKNNTKVEENDVREVSAFVIKQMKRKVEAGANATSRPSKTVSSTPPAKPVKLAETPEEKANKEEREDQKFNR